VEVGRIHTDKRRVIVNVRIEDENLVIELPLEKPWPSSTGKTLLVASTHGVQRTTTRLKGKAISIVANAFVDPDATATKAEKVSPAKGKKQVRHEDEDYEEDEGD
jgi:hypothetical protein